MGFMKRLVFFAAVGVWVGLMPAGVFAQEDKTGAKEPGTGCIGITDVDELLKRGREYLTLGDMESNYFGSDCVLKAAMTDDPVAAFELAHLYLNGKGVLQSKVHAYRWARFALFKGYQPASEPEAFLQKIAEEVTPLEAQEIVRVMREMVSEEYQRLKEEGQEEEKREIEQKMADLEKVDPDRAKEIRAFFEAQEKEFSTRQKEIAEAVEKEWAEEGKTTKTKPSTGVNAKTPANRTRK